MALSPEDMYDKEMMESSYVSDNLYFPNRPSINTPHKNSNKPQKNLEKYQILLKHQSKLNVRIINYFHKNLHMLNAKGIEFEWIPVYEEEIEVYEDQNITKFPVLIIGNDNIPGVSNILNTLDDIIGINSNVSNNRQINRNTSTNRNSNKASVKRDAEEETRDYMLYAMDPKNDKDDDNEGDAFEKDFSRRADDMNKARQNVGQHIVSVTNGNPEIHEKTNKTRGQNNNTRENNVREENNQRAPKQKNIPAEMSVADVVKNTSKGDAEDDMMAKFWENMEETEM